MALKATGNYATTLQQRKDALQWCGIAPAAWAEDVLAEDTALSSTYDDAELNLLLNAQATAINALAVQLETLRSILVEAAVLAEPEGD